MRVAKKIPSLRSEQAKQSHTEKVSLRGAQRRGNLFLFTMRLPRSLRSLAMTRRADSHVLLGLDDNVKSFIAFILDKVEPTKEEKSLFNFFNRID